MVNGGLDRPKSGQFHAAVTVSPKKETPFPTIRYGGEKSVASYWKSNPYFCLPARILVT